MFLPGEVSWCHKTLRVEIFNPNTAQREGVRILGDTSAKLVVFSAPLLLATGSKQRAKSFHLPAMALVLGVPKKSESGIKIPACERTWRRWKCTLPFAVPVVGGMTSIRGTGRVVDISDTVNDLQGFGCYIPLWSLFSEDSMWHKYYSAMVKSHKMGLSLIL